MCSIKYWGTLTASFYGWKVNRTFNPCKNCGIAISRQKNVNKVSEARIKKPGERIFIVQSSIQQKSIGGSKFWLLVIDDCTDFCWSAFLEKKSYQVKWLETLINDLKVTHGVRIKRIRWDNAGENYSFQTKCFKNGFGIHLEFTPPGTPQFNGRVERKFTTLYSRVRAILNGAGLPESLRGGIWPEAANQATDLENIYVSIMKPMVPRSSMPL
jgi:hypothetical protein